jgi:hypothetical protein
MTKLLVWVSMGFSDVLWCSMDFHLLFLSFSPPSFLPSENKIKVTFPAKYDGSAGALQGRVKWKSQPVAV